MKKNYQQDYPFSFDKTACEKCGGKCCTGIPGNIWVYPAEIRAIAVFLRLHEVEFIQEYLIKIRNRWSLKEQYGRDQFACIFFDQQHKLCRIYPVRPGQCRCFPFWNYFRDRVDELVRECPGVTPI